MPKILIFMRHPPTSSMAEFAKALPPLRYIDVGLQVLVKTNIGSGGRVKLGIKSCCYAPASVRVNVDPGRNGRPARPAPQCGAAQRAYAARTCLAAKVLKTWTARKNVDKEERQEMQLAAARDTVEKAFRPPQECRAHEAGRCYKGDQCIESHNVP